jgi:uncharacterized membrane protein YidH (DUF202 family)
MQNQKNTQLVRMADVFVIGPLMTYGGLRMMKSGEKLLGLTLAAFGLATVVYNGVNYIDMKEALDREDRIDGPI